jgi:hypothetical protein
MTRNLIAIACLLVSPSMLLGQGDISPDEAALGASINRVLETIQIVLNEGEQPDSELELVDTQKEQLVALREDYKNMIREVQRLDNEENNTEAATAIVLAKTSSFEKTLFDEILLPHQSRVLKSMVFAKFVKDSGGNMLDAIAKFYPNEFKLDKQQKKRMQAIEDDVAKKVAKAKEKFKLELEKIAKEAQDEARSVLTVEQLKTLKTFAD